MKAKANTDRLQTSILVKKELIKAKNAIRNKYNALKLGNIESTQQFEENFKPLIEPLRSIAGDVKAKDKLKQNFKETEHVEENDDEEYEDEEEAETEGEEVADVRKQSKSTVNLAKKYVHHINVPPNFKKLLDRTTGGVHYDAFYDIYLLGDNEIKFDTKTDEIQVNSLKSPSIYSKYKGTPGLYELIFMAKPKKEFITAEDKETYKKILLETNAYARAKSSDKYKKVVTKILKINKRKTKKKGKGIVKNNKQQSRIGEHMTVTDAKIDYVYWNDINELAERLSLLIASRNAGNTSVDNEIASITEEIEELRKAKRIR